MIDDRYEAFSRGPLAAPGEAICLDELQLAARNHGMPLEALRYGSPRSGLHYLLVHYDIPDVDARDMAAADRRSVERPLSSTSTRSAPGRAARSPRVTIECAGNGRARLLPRPVSHPGWTRLSVPRSGPAPRWRRAGRGGVGAGAVEVVFTGADHGTERGVEQDYATRHAARRRVP